MVALRILCVEDDQAGRESRCAVLESSGYHAVSASPKFAVILLSYQKFDLVVLSGLGDYKLNQIINVADGAEILSLVAFTESPDFLNIVAEKLQHRERI
jgi:CheY-like chemotaxis protein